MRNLDFQSERRHTLKGKLPEQKGKGQAESEIVDLCPFQSDDEQQSRAVLTADGYVVVIGDNEQVSWTRDLNDVCSYTGARQTQGWFSLTYVDPLLVCLNRGGEIVTVSPKSGHAELVGEFENGIDSGEWSPDREVLLLVTSTIEAKGVHSEERRSILLALTSQWEVLAEVEIALHRLPDCLERMVSLAWKPDGTLCAVSSVDDSDGERKIRVYQRETLDFHAIGRTEDGSGRLAPNLLCGGFAWAGPGCSHAITVMQRKGKKAPQVAFFEPNGLRHREFALREAGEVMSLNWNVESDLLAVTLKTECCYKVQLWTRSNYHWYLKRELRYDTGVTKTKFDDEEPYLLYVAIGSDLRWHEYRFRWEPSKVGVFKAVNSAYAIDGDYLNITPLGKAIVPPPMYAASLKMEAPVSSIALACEKQSALLGIAYLCNEDFVLFLEGREESSMISDWCPPHPVGVQIQPSIQVGSLRHIVVAKVHDCQAWIACVTPTPFAGGCETLSVLQFSFSEGSAPMITLVESFQVESHVLSVSAWADMACGALVQLEDGRLFELEIGTNENCTLTPSEADPLLEPCPSLAVLKIATTHDQPSHSNSKRFVIGQTARGRLYCHDLLLADSVSSFCISMEHGFLCYVSAGSRSELRFLALDELIRFDPLLGSDGNVVLQGYEPRNAERGARLVSVLSDPPAAVLQMPRGNLEVVYPRALVFRHVMVQILNRQYKEAFMIMRRQKVDLNLIVDMDPRFFLDDIGGAPAFLDHVVHVDHLNLFISCLHNIDSTQSRYAIPSWLMQTNGCNVGRENFDFASKVNMVCKKLREAMIEAESEGRTIGGREVEEELFLLPILSTFAKEDPPKLEDALILIKESAKKRESTPSKKTMFSDHVQSSIQYLAFLADYELLFDRALGLFDIDLAKAVARSSQMDPKKVGPILKRFAELPMYYGRFEIDLRLKRFESALKNLFMSGEKSECLDEFRDVDKDSSIGNDFEYCLKLINQQELQRFALEVFVDSEHRRRILLSLGESLMSKGQARSALSIFLATDPIEHGRCLSAARECRDWSTYFSLKTKVLGGSEADKSLFVVQAREMAEELAATAEGNVNGRQLLLDAARILLDYGDDVSGAVDLLGRGGLWSEAQRICFLYKRNELASRPVDAAVSYAQTCISDLEERQETFLQSNTRYAEVLKIRKDALVTELDTTALDEEETGSLFSAASNASNSSMRSSSSTGSVGSLSSVISARTATSYTISGEEANRHKSKFDANKGKQKKQRKKKNKGRTKIVPGSERELEDLVDKLRSCCVDELYRNTIEDTIEFLFRNQRVVLARTLYESYSTAYSAISGSKIERIRRALDNESGTEYGQAGNAWTQPHRLEKEVDALSCSSMSDDLTQLMQSIPNL